ncbi:hypothetical protein KGY64_01380 [Candidatus Bipolaricaulota bacterium]|nr:hypothetical protein [Candidatus Bipolaricaulota bacterium]
MKRELEGPFGMNRAESDSPEFKFSYTGMGKDMVKKKFRAWRGGSKLDGVMSVGFAGSIDPELGSGETCLVEHVQTPSSDRYYTADERLFGLLLDVEGMRAADLVSVEDTVTSVEEKMNLASEFDAQMIDQESYWVAEFAETEDVPFVGIRVIYDEIDQELPPSGLYEEETGQVRAEKVLKWLMRDPRQLFSLPRLGVRSLIARGKLSCAIEDSLRVLGEVG